MTQDAQKVLVIQDASRKLCINAIRHALLELQLKPGDKIKLLGVVHPFKTANTMSPTGCIVTRNKRNVHSSATIKKKQEDIEKEVRKKLDEYLNTAEILQAIRVAKMQQIEFEVAVEAGPLKDVAAQFARSLQVTWLILDRQLKRDQRYFLDNLSCGILRIKHDNHIEYVREHQKAEEDAMNSPESGLTSHADLDSYLRETQEIIYGSSLCSFCQSRRPEIGHIKDFTYSELQSAINRFSSDNLLSSHENKIYRGTLSDGQQIVIREHTSATIKQKEFKSHVQMLKTVKHENVMMLLGSCSEEPHRLLVYESVCNDSLDRLLSDRSRDLTWETRMKIAFGAAKGLKYLHKKNIYGNVRPKNILVTHDHYPLLANFGLVKNRYEGLSYSSETRVHTTFEYLAPEYEERGIDWSKADVYSFGVVLLELITGRKTIEDTSRQSFLRWARPLLGQKKYHELIDPALDNSLDLYQLLRMVRVADKCLSWDPERRLSIDKVVMALACINHGCDMEDFSPTESELKEALS